MIVTDSAEVIPDYLDTLKHNGVSNYELTFKAGAICTLMQNMSQAKGLIKNAWLIICKLGN
jgi:hypothetical protein